MDSWCTLKDLSVDIKFVQFGEHLFLSLWMYECHEEHVRNFQKVAFDPNFVVLFTLACVSAPGCLKTHTVRSYCTAFFLGLAVSESACDHYVQGSSLRYVTFPLCLSINFHYAFMCFTYLFNFFYFFLNIKNPYLTRF